MRRNQQEIVASQERNRQATVEAQQAAAQQTRDQARQQQAQQAAAQQTAAQQTRDQARQQQAQQAAAQQAAAQQQAQQAVAQQTAAQQAREAAADEAAAFHIALAQKYRELMWQYGAAFSPTDFDRTRRSIAQCYLSAARVYFESGCDQKGIACVRQAYETVQHQECAELTEAREMLRTYTGRGF